MTGGTVYVVDDDEGVRGALAFLLKCANYSVQTFASGREFLETGTVSLPACIITDVRMPDMSGLELQREVLTRHDGLSVVLMTGHGDEQIATHARQAGVIEFLEKPFSDEQVIVSVQRGLALSRQLLAAKNRDGCAG